MKKKSGRYQGFSFLEAMVSVFVLTMGILAVLPLIRASLWDSIEARDNTIAVLLAQEGVEIVRNIRDNNWATSSDSFDNTRFPGGNNSNCIVSYNSTDVPAGSCTATINGKTLNIDANGYYTHNAGSPTKFKRKIILTYGIPSGPMSPIPTLNVKCAVNWGMNDTDFLNLTSGNISTNCTASRKCTYTEVTLSRWGEK